MGPGSIEERIHLDDLVESPHMYRTVHILLGKSPYVDREINISTLSIVGEGSWKEEDGGIGNNMKTNKFLEMAPQTKPIFSEDLYRNSEQSPCAKV